jgi:hypothetical protein
MVNPSCTPVITVSQDLYDEILLAERVMVVAEGRLKVSRVGGAGLPDFCSIRQCFLTNANDAPAAVLQLMVGG